MSKERLISRREFLSVTAVAAAGAAIVACQPRTVVVKETVEVEKEVEKVVKETVEVEKEVTKVVEKEVTKVIEKIVEVTPSEYNESPTLADMVESGALPPVDERMPADPLVVMPWEETGQYGGTWYTITQVTPHMHVYETLYYEPMVRKAMWDYHPIPNVAEKWEEDDEAKVFTFYMRKGLKWADGEPFTAEDIAFWFEDIMLNTDLTPAFPAWLKAGSEVPRVEVLDDYTVRFSFDIPAPNFMYRISYSNHEAFRPKHYLSQFHAEYADETALNEAVQEREYEDWIQLFLAQNDWNINPELPMCFSWQLDSYEQDGAVWLRNPFYWKSDPEGHQLPYIDRVESLVASNMEVAQMMVFSGEGDLQVFGAGETAKDTMVLKQNEELGDYHVIEAPISEPNVVNLGFNMTHEDEVLANIFRDRRFRIAMSLAMPREDIRQLVYLGLPVEIRQCAPLRESPYYHNGAAQNYVELDLDKANALLDEMGLTERDADGIRLRPDGQPISIVIESPALIQDFTDGFEIAAETWAQIGIKVTAKATETSLYWTRLRGNELMAGTTWASRGGLFVLEEGADEYISIGNRAVWAMGWYQWYASGGEAGVEPPDEVKRQQELWDEIGLTADMDERQELWREIMDIAAENMYSLGICDRPAVPVPVSNKMHNVPDRGWNIAWEAANISTTNPCQYWKET